MTYLSGGVGRDHREEALARGTGSHEQGFRAMPFRCGWALPAHGAF